MFCSEKGKLQHRSDVLHLKAGKQFCPKNTATDCICQSPTALASSRDRVFASVYCNVQLAGRLSHLRHHRGATAQAPGPLSHHIRRPLASSLVSCRRNSMRVGRPQQTLTTPGPVNFIVR